MSRYQRNILSAALLLSVVFQAIPSRAASERECIDCHGKRIGNRSEITRAMQTGSHHVQGVALSGKHCYACHWEATAEGRINERYHKGHLKNKGATSRNNRVNLVLWGNGKRPVTYKINDSAVIFEPSAIGGKQERENIAQISRHCLSCHSNKNNSTRPFEGDPNTPLRYAWDGQSIDARYSRTGSVPWGKYSTALTNGKKKVTKSLSAHGNPVPNQGGWSAGEGYDTRIPSTRGGEEAKPVECFDCHNSHGAAISGITSSYGSIGNRHQGGILKETRSGVGGYAVTYAPGSNVDRTTPNPYNSGAGLCFDCHETAEPGVTPWGYKATFGAQKPIMGYKDTMRFGAGLKGSTSRFANRQTHTAIASSHLKAGKLLNYSTQGSINGLCTPCHDPHGVSPSLGDAMPYAVPLLKGSWLTSPYREDAPPLTPPTKGAYTGKAANMVMSWEKGDVTRNAPSESPASMSYNTDRNTFGEGNHIHEDDDHFAGLCLRCHAKNNFITNRNDRIHKAVKGWGANREHAFPCSKCHQAHNSGLPRLMQTNCLESGPSGLRDSIATPWVSDSSQPDTKSKNTSKESVVGCHVRRAGRNSGPPSRSSDQQQWKPVNPW